MTCSRKYVNKNYNSIFFKDRARAEKKKAQNLNALSMFCMLSLSTHYVQLHFRGNWIYKNINFSIMIFNIVLCLLCLSSCFILLVTKLNVIFVFKRKRENNI